MNLTQTDFLISITTFIILIVVLMMVLIYGVFVKKKSQLLLAQQKKEAQFEQELAISQIEIKEQTLNYIGQELHDDLGQKLSVARLMANRINFIDQSKQVELINEINVLVGECIQDIRNLSKVFITRQVEDFGFVESLDREISRIKRLELMEVEYINNNQYLHINNNDALILFRIVQECINNVIKHSRAKKFYLIIEDRAESLLIMINDDGIGFQERNRNDGSGLKNIQNRAKIINANFRLKSVENAGTKITINYKKK